MSDQFVASWADRLGRFNSEAIALLSNREDSSVRRFSLNVSYDKLKSLNIKEDELFRQALRCVESEVFRAAHIMAWCGFFNCIIRLLESDNFVTLKATRPKWVFSTVEELTENFSEHQIIEILYPSKLVGKADQKSLIGLLSRRNECAHPTQYFPDMNQTLGYISEIFDRLGKIEKKFPGFVI